MTVRYVLAAGLIAAGWTASAAAQENIGVTAAVVNLVHGPLAEQERTLAIGDRGTIFDLIVAPDGATTVILPAGEIVISSLRGTMQLLDVPGLASTVSEPDAAPTPPAPPPPVEAEREAWERVNEVQADLDAARDNLRSFQDEHQYRDPDPPPETPDVFASGNLPISPRAAVSTMLEKEDEALLELDRALQRAEDDRFDLEAEAEVERLTDKVGNIRTLLEYFRQQIIREESLGWQRTDLEREVLRLEVELKEAENRWLDAVAANPFGLEYPTEEIFPLPPIGGFQDLFDLEPDAVPRIESGVESGKESGKGTQD